MMNILVPLLIVAIGPDAPIGQRYPEAIQGFHCSFDETSDENFDGWPDGWTRRRGPGFPHYVKIGIAEEMSPANQRSLRIDLDGGGATAYSPPIAVASLFSYVLEAYVRTEGLQRDTAFVSITFLDKERRWVEAYVSEKIRDTGGWTKLRLGPIDPASEEVRFAVIGLHLEPGERADLKGSALFSDVWLGRLPRMALEANSVHNVFTNPAEIKVFCKASGFVEQDPPVTFILEDVHGRQLAQVERRLDGKIIGGRTMLSLDPDEPTGLVGSVSWSPPISQCGFYRVRAEMQGSQDVTHRREVTLAVIRTEHGPAGNEFGWSLPRGDKPLAYRVLNQLIGQMGVSRIKYPLWYDEEKSELEVERLMDFIERLTTQGIELVGLLNSPPREVARYLGDPDSLDASQIFGPAPDLWYPSLEPMFSRLVTRVRWWQLGLDDDTSFVDYPNLAKKIALVKAQLDRIGQDVTVGIGWDWMAELPEGGENPPWRFLTLSVDPPLTDRELAGHLQAVGTTGHAGGGTAERWVVLKPLSRQDYGTDVRATDLVSRMMAAKMHGADAVFIPDPFDPDSGLFQPDGTPGELLLPWRTAALCLSGADYIGSIQMPEGSENRIFARADGVVMVVWNNRPVKEVLYLGAEVKQMTLWGSDISRPDRDQRQVLQVGPLPTFVTGVSLPVTRWRMDCSLAAEKMPSVFGMRHANALRLQNHFDRGVGGSARLIVPDAWNLKPEAFQFKLAMGEDVELPMEIVLPFDASSGRQKVRIDFEMEAERSYRFSAYRHLDVGLGQVSIEFQTRLNEAGELEVEQRFQNHADVRVSFRCQLFAPGRQRQRTQIVGLGRMQDARIYRLPNGKELIGKTILMRAEEINVLRPRVLNYRFVAKEEE